MRRMRAAALVTLALLATAAKCDDPPKPPRPSQGPSADSVEPSPSSDETADGAICFDGGACVPKPTAETVEQDLKDGWAAANTTLSGTPYPIEATFDPETQVLDPVTWDADGDPNNGGAGQVQAWPVLVWAKYVVDKGDGTPEDDTFYAGCLGEQNTTGDTQNRIIYMVPDDNGSLTVHTGAESDEVSCSG